MKLEILGTRGSMPIGGDEYSIYGTDTSCYLVTTDTQAVFLDAGTGICKCSDVGDRHVSIIISHWHLDHVMGLIFQPLLTEKRDIKIYADLPEPEIKKNFDRLFSEPFWPCTLEDLPANISYHRLLQKFALGELEIEATGGFHPGGCRMIRLSCDGKSVCYTGDFEHTEGATKALASFAKGSDILIYDAQYTADEYESHKGYGHSTKEKGIEIFPKTKCKKIIFTHHNPGHTDTFLKKEEERLQALCSEASIAKPGTVVTL